MAGGAAAGAEPGLTLTPKLAKGSSGVDGAGMGEKPCPTDEGVPSPGTIGAPPGGDAKAAAKGSIGAGADAEAEGEENPAKGSSEAEVAAGAVLAAGDGEKLSNPLDVALNESA